MKSSSKDLKNLAALPGALNGHDAETINSILELLVAPLQSAMTQPTEVVLHDLRRVPNTVRAIAGNVTGRQVGHPPTDFLLERLADGTLENDIGYASHLPDGRQLRCSTIVFRDARGVPAAALCLNSDVSAWMTARSFIDGFMLGTTPASVLMTEAANAQSEDPRSTEYFPHNVEELSAFLIQRALADAGVPVELMRKEHKVSVVEDLEAKGYFLIKDAIETIAAALQVSRFTIYNYLNEINEGAEKSG